MKYVLRCRVVAIAAYGTRTRRTNSATGNEISNASVVAAMTFPNHGDALTKSANASHRPTAGFGPHAMERRTLSLVTKESPDRMSFQ